MAQAVVGTLYVVRLRAKVETLILEILKENLKGFNFFFHVVVLHQEVMVYDLSKKGTWTL